MSERKPGDYDLIVDKKRDKSPYRLLDSETKQEIPGRIFSKNIFGRESAKQSLKPVENVARSETLPAVLKFTDSEEDEINLRPLIDSAQAKTREGMTHAAQELARRQYGIGQDVALPALPDWITDEALQTDERFADSIVVFLPAASQITKQPDLRLYNDWFVPAEDKSHWFRLKYSEEGVQLKGGSELVNDEDIISGGAEFSDNRPIETLPKTEWQKYEN